MAPHPESAATTNWLAEGEQQFWFDRFSSGRDRTADSFEGLNFKQFQQFLKWALYQYFSNFPSSTATSKPRNGFRASEQSDQAADLSRSLEDLELSDLGREKSVAGSEPEGFSKQQEMQLFRKFDLNNDHLLDREEFAHLCQKWLHQVFRPACGLVVVDVQNDFIDGSLALINGPAKQDGAEVIPVVNRLVGAFHERKAAIVYTLDWHPHDHVSFHANLHLRKYNLIGQPEKAANGHDEVAPAAETPKSEREFKYRKFTARANVFDTVLFEDGRVEQKLWPIHCVRNSWGAQFHPRLRVVPDSIKIQKGTLADVDSYSAFWDNMRLNETGLRQELVNKHVTDLFFCGLATDYCVAASALDAIKAGFVTFVVEDACRGIDVQEIERRRQDLVDQGGFIVSSELAVSYLKRGAKEPSRQSESESPETCLSRSLIKTITYRKAFC